MTQSSESMPVSPQQMAQNDVQNNFPDVYRGDEDLRNHAFAVAQQQIQSSSPQTGGGLTVQDFADAYIASYRQAVEERDANNTPNS